MIRSDAHLDAPGDLVRVAHRCRHTGRIGALHGVELVGGVAQNGLTLREANRLIGIVGHDLYIVGPWEPPAAPSAPAPPPPAPTPAAPPARPAAPSPRRR